MSKAPWIIRRPPTLDPGIDRLDPGKAFEQMKYTSRRAGLALTPYNVFLHPSLRLPQRGPLGAPGPCIRAHHMK